MSAVPALRPQYRPQTRPAYEHAVRTSTPARLRPRVVEKPRTNFGAVVCVKAFAFAFLVGSSYLASVLGGQVMVEKARREAIRAVERTRASQMAIEPLKVQIRQAQDPKEIGKWAVANGFSAPEWASTPSRKENTLVASNPAH